MVESISSSHESLPPLRFSRVRRERDTESLAESIARNNAQNNIPVEQVMVEWGIQKGIPFVDKLLATSTYRDLPDEDKEHLRSHAARAIGEEWLRSIGFDSNPLRR